MDGSEGHDVPRISVTTPDELIAALPHIIGFRVENSLVVVPVTTGMAYARVDLPRTPQERAEVVQNLMAGYGRRPGGTVMIIGFADDPAQVEPIAVELSLAMEAADVSVGARLWAGPHQWADLDGGGGGPRTPEAETKVAAEMVLAGRRAPASSRDALKQAVTGDPGPVLRELPAAMEALKTSTIARERQWALGRTEVFAQDGRALSAPDAARMLTSLQSDAIRDQLVARISRDTAATWAPLWDDLTRRSPDELVAPVATLSALAHWSGGDGARAWCALDRIPVEQRASQRLASLVAGVIQAGVHPREWDEAFSKILAMLPPETNDAPTTRGPRPEPPALGEGRPQAGPPAP